MIERKNQLCKSRSCLLINLLLLISSLRISTLLILLIESLRLCWRSDILNWTRIDVNRTWLANSLRVDFLGFDDEDSIRERFLALASGEFVGEDLDFDTEDTLTKENVAGSGIDKVTDLFTLEKGVGEEITG